ncbi:MAG TPA: hypothetical protein VKP67_19745 [Xanthobacteraceae bacterium]|nr:hypothetical protein [Xanthobacteraceae bacterium]
MLPNLRILICGVVFGPLLFAATGAGVLRPDSYTRVGEMPEVSRPMMQRVIVDEPAQAQFHLMNVARRSEELERLRERSVLEVASVLAQPESDLSGPAILENPASDDISATDMAAPGARPSGGTGTVPETSSGSVQVRAAEIETDAAPRADPVLVATLPSSSAEADQIERAPSLLKVPLPPLRLPPGTGGIHRHVLHRKPGDVQGVVQAPPDTLGQILFGPSLLAPQQQNIEKPRQ